MSLETIEEQIFAEMKSSFSPHDLVSIGDVFGLNLSDQFAYKETHDEYIRRICFMLLYHCLELDEIDNLFNYCFRYSKNLKFMDLSITYLAEIELYRSKRKEVKIIQPRVKSVRRAKPVEILKPNLKNLTKNIAQCFNFVELALLCLSLDIRYDQISGDTIDAKAYHLVLYFERRLELDRLIDECRKERPKVDWDVYE